MYSMYLSRQGFAIAEAGTGQGAVDQAATLAPDLIVMDLSLPDMDGALAIQRIRNAAPTRDTPIIVVSGHGLAGEIESSLWNSFLTKPCLPDSLTNEIRRLLDDTRASISP